MYIPIESVELYVYLAYKQLIIPFKYRPNARSSIQSHFPNQILLSKNKWIENCDVSVEVDINEKELIYIGEGFYLLNNILPIGKIKKVSFRDKEQMQVTIGNIKISSGFVPERWLEIDNSPIDSTFNIEKLEVPQITAIDFTDNIYLFDKYMGGLITLQNFKEDFAEVLSYLDKNSNIDSNNKLVNFLDKESSLKNIIMQRQIDLDDVKSMADKENISLKTIARMIKTDLIDNDSYTYIYAILHKYRRLLKDNFDGLVNEIDYLKNTNIEKYKGLIFLYGIMSGYSKLSFKLYFKGKVVCNRFKYEDEKDFKTIESVYNKVFKEFVSTKSIKITRKERIIELESLNLANISILDLSEKFKVSERTIKKDLKEIILKSSKTYFKKNRLLKKFNMRMDKGIQYLELEKSLKSNRLTLLELAEKYGISEKTLKAKIANFIKNSNFSYLEKQKLFIKFKIRIIKSLQIIELEKILKKGKIKNQELSEKLQVSLSSIQRYKKEIKLKEID